MSKLEDLMEKYTKTEDKDNAQFIMSYDKDGKQYITLIRDYYKIRDGFIDLIQKEMNEYLKEKESYEKKEEKLEGTKKIKGKRMGGYEEMSRRIQKISKRNNNRKKRK